MIIESKQYTIIDQDSVLKNKTILTIEYSNESATVVKLVQQGQLLYFTLEAVKELILALQNTHEDQIDAEKELETTINREESGRIPSPEELLVFAEIDDCISGISGTSETSQPVLEALLTKMWNNLYKDKEYVKDYLYAQLESY